MGYKIVDHVMSLSPKSISKSNRSVLVVLAESANQKNWSCWPSVGRIAQRAGVSKRTAQRCLNWLSQQGFILSQDRIGTSSYYTLVPEKIISTDQDVMGGVTPCHPYPGQTVTPPVTRCHPNQNITRNIEPELNLAHGAGELPEFFNKGLHGEEQNMKVKDMLSKGDNPLNRKKPKATLLREMTRVWVQIPQYFDDVVYVAPLTKKQEGQMKLIAEKCPDGRHSEILLCLIRNWVAFTKVAREKAGLYSIPSEPSIAFILSHVGIAVNFFFNESKTNKPVKSGDGKVTESLTASAPASKPEVNQDAKDDLAKKHGLDVPWESLPESVKQMLLSEEEN